MKKNKFSALLACFVLSTLFAFADVPFRNHRYDAFKALEVTPQSIVFYGNSITNMHEWWEAFGNHNVVNRGNSGGYSHELVDNLETIISGHPAKLFIMIGTNDLGSGYTPNHVVGNIRTMIERTQLESPATKIYIQSILPSTNGSRTLATLSQANNSLKALCEEKDVTYIDLWNDLMGITSGTSLSLDGLHLKATGYKIWCDKIAQYVGSSCTYLDNATVNSQAGGLAGSSGMRCTYFGGLQVKDGDVLIIGDEMIHGGEWHELLHCDKIKNRGTNWGYGGLTLAQTLGEIPVILKGRTDNGTPAKVFLYAGVSEVNGTTNIATLKTSYQNIVNKIRELAPSTKVYLMSLIPRSSANTRIPQFNTELQSIASAMENVEYVDIYTPLASGNVANTDYITGDYVYAKGYAKISEVLAPYLTEEGATATTVEKVEELVSLYSNRATLLQTIVKGQQCRFGTGAGTYPESLKADFDAALGLATQALVKENVTAAELASTAAEVQQAYSSLKTSLNQPTASTEGNEVWHQLYTPLRESRYLTSNGAGAGVTGEVKNTLAKSMWKFVGRQDGSFDIVNREDGSYLNPVAGYNTQITTSATAPDAGWTLEYANTQPYYIVHSGTVELNQTQSGLAYKVYNWSSNSNGLDRDDTGCQFLIEETDFEPSKELEAITEEGWYKFQIASGDATMQGFIDAGTHTVLNAENEFRQSATNYYPFKYAAYDANKAPTAWIHVKKVDSKFQLQGLNGHTLQEPCLASRDQTLAATTITVVGSDATIDKWHYYINTGAESPYVGKSSNSSNTFTYARIADSELEDYDHYTVSITGATDAAEVGLDASVTCSNSANKGIAKVFNGGHFFFPKGTAITAADFTGTVSNGKTPQITITGNSIIANYGDVPSKEFVVSQATELLGYTGVGTPRTGSPDRTNLENALQAASADDSDAAALLTLQIAIEQYQSSTDLELPQAGKAYTFTNVQQSGTTYALYAAEDGTLSVAAANTTAASLGNSAIFVCGEADGKYYFANGLTGKYLVWKGHKDGTNGNTGYLPSYDATYCLLSLGSGSESSFGTMYIHGKRATGADGCFIIASDGQFNAWTSGVAWAAGYSDLFYIDEVEYPNVVTTEASTELGNVGLFSAPFPAVAPAGTKVYTTMTDRKEVGLIEIESGIVPANTGVVVVSDADHVAMIPATAAGTTPEENLLEASGLEGTTVDSETAAYGLVVTDGVAAFQLLDDRTVAPNSAYLVSEDTPASMEIRLGRVTGIASAANAEKAGAPVYDLSGRRIATPTRGIYIQGGKKVLVE